MSNNASAIKLLSYIWQEVILRKRQSLTILLCILTGLSFLSMGLNSMMTLAFMLVENTLLNIVLTYITAARSDDVFANRRSDLILLVKRFFLRVTTMKMLTMIFSYMVLKSLYIKPLLMASIVLFGGLAGLFVTNFGIYHCIIEDIEIKPSIIKGFETLKKYGFLFAKVFLIEIIFFVPVIIFVMKLYIGALTPLLITLFSICNELCIITICLNSIRNNA